MPTLTIVAPFYDERETAERFAGLVEKLCAEVERRFGLATETILVDDGSNDDGASVFAKHLTGQWKIVRLSRNFGKEVALYAGIENASGDLILLMDADLQHSFDTALALIETIVSEPELDVVHTVRQDRRSGLAGNGFARLFYRLINVSQRYDIPANAGDFRIMRRTVANAFLKLRDKRRFNKGLYAWAGFRQRALPYTPVVRAAGRSKWSRLSLLSFSLEGFTSFSVLPLRVMSVIGLVLALAGIGYGIKIVLEVLAYGVSVPGFPSLIVAVVVLGGFNLALLGLVGEYVWVAVSEVKDRPIYIVREVVEGGPSEADGAEAK